MKGKYPKELLKQWDIFHEEKESQNDRPGGISIVTNLKNYRGVKSPYLDKSIPHNLQKMWNILQQCPSPAGIPNLISVLCLLCIASQLNIFAKNKALNPFQVFMGNPFLLPLCPSQFIFEDCQ